MSTATLKKRPTKPKRRVPPVNADLEEDRMESFYMPAAMSLDEFRQWTYSDDFPEYGRITYLGKEIFVDMSAERIHSHGSVKVEIYATLGKLIRKQKQGKFFPDGTRFVHPAAKLSAEPDSFYATWESLKNGVLREIPTADEKDGIELEGTPDWVVEIISPSSVTKDRKKLRKGYHRAGIPEYWLIDARGDEVEFDILVYGDEDYEPAKNIGGWQVSPTFGKRFRLRRIVDPTGKPDYRLQLK